MSKTRVKIPSQQGGPFHLNNKNLEVITFELPNDGNYDMSKSYLNFDMEVPSTLVCPLDVNCGKAGSVENVELFNLNFIRNAKLYYSGGVIENILDVNVLRQNLIAYTASQVEKQSAEYKALYNVDHLNSDTLLDLTTGGSNTRITGFREFNTEGSVASRNVVQSIQVPLHHLFDFCKLKSVPMDKLQGAYLEIETEYLRLPTFSDVAIESVPCANQDNIADGASVDTVSVARADRIKALIYVGQTLTFNFKAAGADTTTTNCVVNNISIDETTGNAQITVNKNIYTNGSGGAVGLTDIKFTSQTDISDEKPLVNSAELIMEQTNMKAEGQLEYTTFTLERDSGGNTKNYQRTMIVEPECFNVFAMFPNSFVDVSGGGEAPSRGSENVSQNDTVVSYRLQCNSEDLTNRDVLISSNGTSKDQASLYYDRIMTTMKNGGYMVKNLREFNGEKLICNYLPMTEQPKLLQLNINASAGDASRGVQNVYVYKQMVKTI